jgi:tRNA(Arg) A34 adenosine deaminase TadA
MIERAFEFPAAVGSEREAMALAIRAARVGVELGQSPFGCCIIAAEDKHQDTKSTKSGSRSGGGRVLACCYNTVWRDRDPTRHAEVNAIRDAARALASIDLSGCALLATCEPCPMCYSAAHWARVSRIVYGASIVDADRAGFSEMAIPVERVRDLTGDGVEIVSGLMADECRELFDYWQKLGRGAAY